MAIDELSGFSGDSCIHNERIIFGGFAGGSIILQAEILVIDEEISASGLNGYELNGSCGGSGSGGSLLINTTTLVFTDKTKVSTDGGGCCENCTTGGAGSAGFTSILYH